MCIAEGILCAHEGPKVTSGIIPGLFLSPFCFTLGFPGSVFQSQKCRPPFLSGVFTWGLGCESSSFCLGNSLNLSCLSSPLTSFLKSGSHVAGLASSRQVACTCKCCNSPCYYAAMPFGFGRSSYIMNHQELQNSGLHILVCVCVCGGTLNKSGKGREVRPLLKPCVQLSLKDSHLPGGQRSLVLAKKSTEKDHGGEENREISSITKDSRGKCSKSPRLTYNYPFISRSSQWRGD